MSSRSEPAPPASTAPAYGTVLVPIFAEDAGAAAIGRAAKLTEKGGTIHAVFLLAVPPELPLDAELRQAEARGRAALEGARIQARRAGVRIRSGVIRTRNPGATLVAEAQRLQADAIYLSTLHAPAGERRIGPTALYLLSRRPCSVLIETDGLAEGLPQ
jgi:nucleotide-binding universal stress UspA family protein